MLSVDTSVPIPAPAQNCPQLHGARKARAIAALLEADNISEAARLSNISRRTLNYWLAQDDFKQEFLKAQREFQANHVSHTVNRLSVASVGAVNVLIRIAHDEAQPAAARVSAAKALIQLTLEATTIPDIESRLRLLEQDRARTIESQVEWSDSDGAIHKVA